MYQRKYGTRHEPVISVRPISSSSRRVCATSSSRQLVSADHGYAQHFHLRRLNQASKALHITAAGPRTILIDDDPTDVLRGVPSYRRLVIRGPKTGVAKFLITSLFGCS